jgi:SAM-dependent methyltransferase
MSERRGFWSILEYPIIYEGFHHLIGARRWLRRFANEVVRAKGGDVVLDIGCGPAPLSVYVPESCTYIGFDYNKAYIGRARRAYGERGRFICDDVGNFALHNLPRADVAVAIGMLHHIDDDLAARMLKATAATLKPGGRLITVDPCYHPEQSALQRFVVSHDRGLYVRPFERYVELCGTVFNNPAARFQRGHLPFPHSICIVEAVGR